MSGLKYQSTQALFRNVRSHPTRGEWIEMPIVARLLYHTVSHPTRGEWIEIANAMILPAGMESHPTRGEWIEINPKS